MKPLGRKNYGSIGHLPSSRLGPGDHHVTEGQARIATEKTRDKHDVVIVQEKLDGSNVGICKVNGEILALSRAGYLATSSKYEQHHLFAAWVEKNRDRFERLLEEGERVCGEWLAMAHGTLYRLRHEPFVAFDVMRGEVREPFEVFRKRCREFTQPHLISCGPPMAVAAALASLGEYGHHGALDPVEGAIWRVERQGKVDFLAKFVKHDKVDGKYFEETTGKNVWNFRAEDSEHEKGATE